MEGLFFQILILLFIVYSVIPTVLVRLGRVGALSRGPAGERRVALTFDDGPDPRYTPKILEILKQYQVKACFFVTGSKVRAHPELARQIIRDGHEIGNHGFKHKAVWLLGPVATTREIVETNRSVKEHTGQMIRYYRPAWGLFNLFSICYYRLKGLKVVLWTYMSWDWTKRATSESITRKALSRIRDGAILIFHDGDFTPGAAKGGPAKVAAALPVILEELKQKELRVVTLEDLTKTKKPRRGSLKKCIQKLWSVAEVVIRKLAGIRDLGDGNSSIWRVALRRYRGKDWPMPDGSVLQRGDYYLELHANNDRLLRLLDEDASVEMMAITAMKEMRAGLPALAELLSSNKRFSKAKVLFGITLLHRMGGRFGFTSYDIKPGLFSRLTYWYEKWLLAIFHPKSLKSYRSKLSPKYVVMTRQELMRRYPPRKARSARPRQSTKNPFKG